VIQSFPVVFAKDDCPSCGNFTWDDASLKARVKSQRPGRRERLGSGAELVDIEREAGSVGKNKPPINKSVVEGFKIYVFRKDDDDVPRTNHRKDPNPLLGPLFVLILPRIIDEYISLDPNLIIHDRSNFPYKMTSDILREQSPSENMNFFTNF
jgi:hypothetical protein